uniref:Transposase n=1 Tax=Macrostomum lignano TaxID=282301 RepID=A0A1I8FFY9_9PLAT
MPPGESWSAPATTGRSRDQSTLKRAGSPSNETPWRASLIAALVAMDSGQQSVAAAIVDVESMALPASPTSGSSFTTLRVPAAY